jgi:hypothetical protein
MAAKGHEITQYAYNKTNVGKYIYTKNVHSLVYACVRADVPSQRLSVMWDIFFIVTVNYVKTIAILNPKIKTIKRFHHHLSD